MTFAKHPFSLRVFRKFLPASTPARAALGLGVAVLGGVMAIGPARLIAQVEGERGIAPVIATGDIEVNGVEVEATGKTAAEARATGWNDAVKKAWEQAHGPTLDIGTLNTLVSSIVVEHEEIGPHRYRARLGVVFDRGRAAQYVSGNGTFVRRSAPMLVLPVLYSGGVAQVFEVRTAWQKVWAEFHTGASAIDYVRANGAGGDSLLLTAGQAGRRSRVWWRGILDQYGASDVLVPEARLERQWPGGPVKGTFTARYGVDNQFIATFTLTAPDEGGVPAMLGQALGRIDQIYTDALARGVLRPDPTLSLDHPAIDPGLQSVIDAGRAADAAEAAAQARADAAAQASADAAVTAPPPAPAAGAKPAPAPTRQPVQAHSVQFASADARAVDQALAGVRGTPGVENVATTSIAIGGTSVMRVNFAGTQNDLIAALRARGWQVSVVGNALRIRR
ncbi:MAG TPA: heavy-metal-associated domain-containing protein [Novosphingobium sp.]|nr:heavy-metal-associated domain-containing protein [Novosphingobium sp.]